MLCWIPERPAVASRRRASRTIGSSSRVCRSATAALSGPGKWVVRHHLGGKADYETETFGTPDDFSDADGIAILNFWQAQVKARERMVERAHGAAKIKASLTVADCVDQSLNF
jgi:hypothetical protein